MLYPSINEIRKKADSRYTLVILAAKRARDIIDGKPILSDVDIDRPVSIAAHEIADDLITYTRPEENEEAEAAEVAEAEAPEAEAEVAETEAEAEVAEPEADADEKM